MRQEKREHLDFVNEYLPRRKVRGRSLKALDNEFKVNALLNTFVIGNLLPTGETKELEKPLEKERAVTFETKKAQKLYVFYHEKLGNNFGTRHFFHSDLVTQGLMEATSWS